METAFPESCEVLGIFQKCADGSCMGEVSARFAFEIRLNPLVKFKAARILNQMIMRSSAIGEDYSTVALHWRLRSKTADFVRDLT